MDALLEQVLDANGGLEHLQSLTSLRAKIAYGGPFWEFKGHPDFTGTDVVEASLQRQHFRQHQEATGRTIVFDRDQDTVTVTGRDGKVIDQLEHPRESFAGFDVETPWSLAQIAYFRSYATSHYLLEPYLFTWPGVEAHEIEPWTEAGETWRVLAVTYPTSIDVHSRTQHYYYDDAAHLKRLDYDPEVNGDVPVAHYVLADKKVNGVLVATAREIHLRNEDRTPDLSWTSITVDLSDIDIT